MTADARFLDMMPDTCVLYAPSGMDGYGKRSWSTSGSSYRCRMEPADRVQRTRDGREIHVTGTLYLYTTATITTDHKLVLPDGRTATIASVTMHRDETGASHVQLNFGNT